MTDIILGLLPATLVKLVGSFEDEVAVEMILRFEAMVFRNDLDKLYGLWHDS